MYADIVTKRVEKQISVIKINYEQYERVLAKTFQGSIPHIIVNREREIRFLFLTLEQFLPLNAALNVKNTRLTGEQLYRSIEKQIAQLDFVYSPRAYEVQKILQEIRVCFYYMLQAVDEINREKNVDI